MFSFLSQSRFLLTGLAPVTLIILIVSVAAQTVTAQNSSVSQPDSAGPNRSRQPNIVLINLDDADREIFRPEVLSERFPTMAQLASQGIRFTNFHVTTPLCGPSRACLLRGQYAHAIAHRTNESNGLMTRGFGGDLASFHRAGYTNDDVGRWMNDAGYQTAFVGKYINYVKMDAPIPAGWDHFYRSQGSKYYGTSRFSNRYRREGAADPIPADTYRTNAEADDVVRLIKQMSDAGKQSQPFFVYFAPFGPHSQGKAPGGMVDRDLADHWPDLQQHAGPDYNEDDISDKPPAYQLLSPLSDQLKTRLQQDYRNRMLATLSIDRAIGRIVKTLKSIGHYENTILMITSDNGYSLGEHRISGKGVTMTRSAHVPMIVTGPGVVAGKSANHLLGHIDIAPTLLELAGGDHRKEFFDGKSFARLLTDPESVPERSWRDSLLIENWQSRRFGKLVLNTTYLQLRMYDSVFSQWADGSREYYDLSQDPHELQNQADRIPVEQLRDMIRQIAELRRPMPDPIATVDRIPVQSNYQTNAPAIVSGVAEDSSGITRVELVIRKWSTQQFWNGTAWQADRFTLSAELKNPGGIQTEWTYQFQIPSTDAADEGYTVVPRAFAKNGKRTHQVLPGKLVYDHQPPSTIINTISFPESGKVRVRGQARDNHRTSSLKICLFNKSKQLYFDGKKWAPEKSFLTFSLQDSGPWEWLSPKVEPGDYILRARAYDQAGNYDLEPAVKPFTVVR